MVKLQLFKKNVYLKDVIIALVIIALPFLYYSYRYFPNTQTWEGYFFTIDSGNFENVNFFMCLVSIKLYLILVLSVWFITCKNWWRYAILVPLIIELFKLFSLLNDNVNVLDEIEYKQSFPLTIPIIIILIFLSNKIGHFSRAKNLYQDLNFEINNQITKFSDINNFEKFNKKFKILISRKEVLDKESYLRKLIGLRNEIYKKF